MSVDDALNELECICFSDKLLLNLKQRKAVIEIIDRLRQRKDENDVDDIKWLKKVYTDDSIKARISILIDIISK